SSASRRRRSRRRRALRRGATERPRPPSPIPHLRLREPDMSQYQGPYNPPPPPQPPPGYYYPVMQPPPPTPLAPARRASIVMFILGGLMLACGGTCAGFSFFPADKLPADPNTGFQELDDMATREVGIGFMQIMFIAGLVLLAPGLLYLI